MDVEPGFAKQAIGISHTLEWEEGFQTGGPTSLLINDTGTDGLPPGSLFGWTGATIVNVTEHSYGVIPQIYTNGAAKEWHDLSVDEFNRQREQGLQGYGLSIFGVLT